MKDERAQGSADSTIVTGSPLPAWDDVDPTPAAAPGEWLGHPRLAAAADSPPPQLVRTVNLLDVPEHSLSGPEDVEGIADFLLARAREGLSDLFAHQDYDTCSGEGEEWARAIAEHQTGIPYTMPAYFFDGPQSKIARAIVDDGRYPLAGQCQQSVTTALCMGGWDGGAQGDVGAGIDAQPAAAKLGVGWTKVPLVLADWPDDLWDQVTVGACLFWSAPCPMTRNGETCHGSFHVPGCGRGSGHVAMVIRKHPSERKWQLWDTTTSFNDPVTHPAAAKGARMLWESHWWSWITKTLTGGLWQFRGVARMEGLDTLRAALKPRGRCRLLLRRRRDGKLVYRSAWMSMEQEGLPISWLLRSMRGAPFFDEIEAMWCVNSACDKPTATTPDNRPLLDVFCDARGNARMSWTPLQGLHNRPHVADWSPMAPFGASSAVESPPASSPTPDPDSALVSELFSSEPAIQKVIAKKAAALVRGARGPAVTALQTALLQLGYDIPGGADGDLGAGTVACVKAFQAQQALPITGIADATMLEALDAALASGGPCVQ